MTRLIRMELDQVDFQLTIFKARSSRAFWSSSNVESLKFVLVSFSFSAGYDFDDVQANTCTTAEKSPSAALAQSPLGDRERWHPEYYDGRQ